MYFGHFRSAELCVSEGCPCYRESVKMGSTVCCYSMPFQIGNTYGVTDMLIRYTVLA